MSRETKEIRRRLSGKEADPYLGLGRKWLGELKESMKMLNLQQLVRTRDLENGVRITVMSIFGQDEVRITVPIPVPGGRRVEREFKHRLVLVGRSINDGLTDQIGDQMATRWENDLAESLGVLPNDGVLTQHSSSAEAITSDPDNEIIVGYSIGIGISFGSPVNVFRAFEWSRSDGMRWLVGLPTAFDTNTGHGIARGISSDGSVVVGVSGAALVGSTARAVMWDSERKVSGFLGDVRGDAFGVSGDGRVIVGSWGGINNTAGFAFRWTVETGTVQLSDERGSQAIAASKDGSVVVGRLGEDSGFQMFVWTAATGIVMIPTVSGDDGFFSAVSDDGITAVGFDDDGIGTPFGVGLHKAVRWTRSGGLDYFLDGPGGDITVTSSPLVPGSPISIVDWTTDSRPSTAQAISEDGSVIGGHYNPTADTSPINAFYWTESTGLIPLAPVPGYSEATVFDVTSYNSREETVIDNI